jgi:NADH-quinone oxidoreductase subunit B
VAFAFATSCCGIEFMATMASHYDLARFGSERVSFSPRQADMLMVMGTIKENGAYITSGLRTNVRASLGNCWSLCSGGIFDTYSVLQGIDKVIPVDVYSWMSAKTRTNC